MTPAHQIFATGLAVAVALFTAPARAELAGWDQSRVTGIAQQLAQACDAWEQAVREQPGAGAEASEFGLGMKARVLTEQSQALAGHLAKGDGHDKTRNYYRDLKALVDDTEEMAQRSELDDPTMAAWAKVVDLQRQIAPYYDPRALGAGAAGAGE
jgi:hypothetical protein